MVIEIFEKLLKNCGSLKGSINVMDYKYISIELSDLPSLTHLEVLCKWKVMAKTEF